MKRSQATTKGSPPLIFIFNTQITRACQQSSGRFYPVMFLFSSQSENLFWLTAKWGRSNNACRASRTPSGPNCEGILLRLATENLTTVVPIGHQIRRVKCVLEIAVREDDHLSPIELDVDNGTIDPSDPSQRSPERLSWPSWERHHHVSVVQAERASRVIDVTPRNCSLIASCF